jgi:hypothetical protein
MNRGAAINAQPYTASATNRVAARERGKSSATSFTAPSTSVG